MGQPITSTQPQVQAYEPESLYGTDYYCPRCWEERQVKEVLGDVADDSTGKDVFEEFYCEYCFNKHNSQRTYNPAKQDLHEYVVGGPLGYPPTPDAGG